MSLRPGTNTTKRCTKLLTVHHCRGRTKRNRHGIYLVPASTRKAGPTSSTVTNLGIIPIGYSRENGVSVTSLGSRTRTRGSGLSYVVIACPSARKMCRRAVGRLYSVIRTGNNRICVSNTGVGTRMNLAYPNYVNTSIYRLGLRGAFTVPRNNNNPNVKPVNMTRRLMPFLPKRLALNRRRKTMTSTT